MICSTKCVTVLGQQKMQKGCHTNMSVLRFWKVSQFLTECHGLTCHPLKGNCGKAQPTRVLKEGGHDIARVGWIDEIVDFAGFSNAKKGRHVAQLVDLYRYFLSKALDV